MEILQDVRTIKSKKIFFKKVVFLADKTSLFIFRYIDH